MLSKLAVITGASKGIGRAVAIEAAKSGLDVLIIARNVNELNSLSAEIGQTGQKCYIVLVELNNFSESDKIVAKIKKCKQQVALVVHSAGVAKIGNIKDMPIEDWDLNIKTNLTVPFVLTQKLLPFLESESHIIFINSVAGRQIFTEWSSYCASKYGLKAFADTLRQEIAPQRIKVTTIYPASVDTPMMDSLPYNWDKSKMLQAEEVAKAVMHCYFQPENVQIKELDIENCAGTF